MIVKLHDGTEGELVGWVREVHRLDVPYRTFSAEIVVLREGSRGNVLAVLWESGPVVTGGNPDVHRRLLLEAMSLAGLCFWPDPKGRDLDLSPWVRDLIAKAYHEGFAVGVTPILDIPKIETQPGAATIFGGRART